MTDLLEHLFKAGKEPYGDRIHKYFKLERINNVAELLEPDELEVIRRSRLGELFKIGRRFAYSGKLAHFLLTRKLVIAKEHEIWFIFTEKPIRFSLREFRVVSGLLCNKVPPPLQDNNIKRKKLGHRIGMNFSTKVKR